MSSESWPRSKRPQISKQVLLVNFLRHLNNIRREAVKAADLVIEAIIEDLGIKQKLFASIDSIAPSHCIFATNTSSLSVADIAAQVGEARKEKSVLSADDGIKLTRQVRRHAFFQSGPGHETSRTYTHTDYFK